MILHELLRRLGATSLSNLPCCENYKIKENALQAVVEAINDGLARLYEKMDLKSDNIIVETCHHRSEYPLTLEHCKSRMPKDVPIDFERYNFYIYDPHDHFKGDILQIRDIYDSQGKHLPLNDRYNEYSILTTKPNTICVPYVRLGQVLDVSYLAAHPRLDFEHLDAVVDIPQQLEEALCNYVAYSLHTNINTEEAVQNAMKYKQAYDMIIQQVIDTDSINHNRKMDTAKFTLGGWV